LCFSPVKINHNQKDHKKNQSKKVLIIFFFFKTKIFSYDFCVVKFSYTSFLP
jgi:hypothetical protein